MLLSLMKYLRGYVYVQLTGYAPERFLNLCGNRDILVWNLKPCEGGYCFCISVWGFKQLKPILRKTRTHIRILSRHGVPFYLFRYRRRKVYAFGILLFCGFLYYLSGFIWNIEVTGNSYLSEEMVLDFLKEQKCAFGAKKSEINCADLEEELRSAYADVIWTSIQIYGTKMTVSVQENLLPEESYQKEEDQVYDIVAAKDGIIEQMVTRAGTPLAGIGSEVAKGDVLVSGRMELLNDSGELLQYLYHSCDADIIAKVTYDYRDEIPIDYIKKEKTGNVRTDYQLEVCGKVIKNPFFQPKFDDYSVVSDTAQLHFTHNFYLPVSLVTQTYEEYRQTKAQYTKEEAKSLATKNLKNYLRDLQEKGIQIIGKNVMIEKKNHSYVVTGTIDALESIVTYQPTELMDITDKEVQDTDESE